MFACSFIFTFLVTMQIHVPNKSRIECYVRIWFFLNVKRLDCDGQICRDSGYKSCLLFLKINPPLHFICPF